MNLPPSVHQVVAIPQPYESLLHTLTRDNLINEALYWYERCLALQQDLDYYKNNDNRIVRSP